jgi:hypothetical protein
VRSSNADKLPGTTVSMLFRSCAMPPASWPTASIFCACISVACVRFCSVMSADSTKTPCTSPSLSTSGTISLRAWRVSPSTAIAYS